MPPRTDGKFDRLGIDDAGPEGQMLVTIATARIVNFNKDYLADDGDRKVVLTFDETGDKEYVVNNTSFRLLCDRYGNDKANGFKSWIGKEVVLKVTPTTDPRDGSPISALWVARPKDWDTVVRVERKARGTAPRRRRS